MSILLRKVKIIDSKSPYNGFVKDVLINNDQIVQIDDYIEASARKVIEEDGLVRNRRTGDQDIKRDKDEGVLCW